MMFSNVLFQGLLHLHALLDNPFGHDPAKFPLRAFIAQVIGTTDALASGAHRAPRSSSISRARASARGAAGTGKDD